MKMKTCPNCNADVEDNFELCWSCNYSFKENKVVEIRDVAKTTRDIDCLRCGIPTTYAGEYKFHEGTRIGFLGNLFEAFVNREKFDLYICPQCGKVEFFVPLKEIGEANE
jgi:hypothetical protein